MDKDQEQKLVFKIADLIRENTNLSNQLKELTDNYQQLSQKADRFENILSSLPPDLIPKEIEGQKTRTQRFEMATVLYADIQGFKKISEQSKSSEIIDELDQIFFHFNSIGSSSPKSIFVSYDKLLNCLFTIPS